MTEYNYREMREKPNVECRQCGTKIRMNPQSIFLRWPCEECRTSTDWKLLPTEENKRLFPDLSNADDDATN